jgi:hypothetical protein
MKLIGSRSMTVGAAALLLAALLVLPQTLSLSAAGGPDVIIQSITVDPAIPNAGQMFTLTVTLKNQGSATTGNPFLNTVYLDPPVWPPTTTTCLPAYDNCAWRFSSASALGAGATTNIIRSNDPKLSFPISGCNHLIYAFADYDHTITETLESNNVLSQTVCVGVTGQPDAFEPDNTCGAARWITSTAGISQHHTLWPEGDVDWLKFGAMAGVTYTIQAKNLEPHTDPVLFLSSACGGVPQFGTGPRIDWRAPASGPYYLRVEQRQAPAGPLTGYDLSVTSDDSGLYDPYEPDNTCAESRDIATDGTRQKHYFQMGTDEDWVKFPLDSGETYVIVADNPGPGVSPQLSLYSACGLSVGSPITYGQQTSFDSSSAGILYARAVNPNPVVSGTNAYYDLSVNTVVCSGDSYEGDDTAAQAKTVSTTGITTTHTICPAGDQDWIKFAAISGTLYTLETSELGTNADTILFLYGTDGVTELARNDDYAAGLLASRILWTAPASGTYYAMAKHVKAAAAGAATRYDLAVYQGMGICDTFDAGAGDSGPGDSVHILTNGTAQSHNFCSRGDQDWVQFQAPAAGMTFTIQTSALGDNVDTVLEVYGPGGATLLGSDDDYGPGAASLIQFTATVAGTYYARAFQYDTNSFGSGTGYDLSVQAQAVPTPTPSPTPSPTATPTPSPTPAPNDVRTLILVNRERFETLYTPQAASQLMDKLYQLASHPRVQGLVVQVELAPSVATAYDAWTEDQFSLLDTSLANDVAGAVRNLALGYLNASPNVTNVVIVGDDRIIPFRRISDSTSKTEDTYSANVTMNTTQWAAYRDAQTLTDDYYADRVPTPWSGGELYLPDYGLGRLVETPDEIMAFIDAFLAKDGIVAQTALVTGYDFVRDAAGAIRNLLVADSFNPSGSLIALSWNGSDLRSQQLAATPRFDIQSINGHADHLAEKTPDHDDILASQVATATADLTGAIIYTLGCHSGFNDTGTLDLAQAFMQKKANYVANTGYGWGGGNIAWSEALMRYYTIELLSGASTEMGGALARAKTTYYNQASYLTAYDQKALAESTFYGLPMYVITTGLTFEGEDPFPSMAVTPTLPSGGFGALNTGHVNARLSGAFGGFDLVTDTQATFFGHGSYFSVDGSVDIAAGSPVQPRFFADLSAPSAGTLRGVLFRGGVYTDVAAFDPIIVQALNEYISPTVEPAFTVPGWYPAVPFLVRNRDTVPLAADTAVALMGQFNSQAGTERLYDQLAFDTYYSADPDVDPPDITYIGGVLNQSAGQASLKVEASDPSGVVRVLAAFTEGQGQWLSQDLAFNTSTHKWRGQITATINTRYFLQAVDGAGNIQVADNKGAYYSFQPPAPLVGAGGGSKIYLPVVLRNY